MTITCAHSISASLAALRSGGWVCLVGLNKTIALRAVSTDDVLKNSAHIMSKRFAMAKGIKAEDVKPDMAVVVGLGTDLDLPDDLPQGILALLKMAHVTPACEISVGDDQGAKTTIETSCLIGLLKQAYPLVFNKSITMPTTWSDQTELHLFSEQQDAKREHLAAICHTTQSDEPPLVRVHSKCVTGDIFDSLRCDCGEQLATAKYMIGASGNGILVYLDQEGRGIGLRNKLAAYELQDTGVDTFQANHQLGYEADERSYLPAITILEHLGVTKIRLLTNNPDKIEQLGSKIQVVERVPLVAASEPKRQSYIEAKKQSGHLL